MGAQIGGTSEYNSEINVTPMVDVMLVLLIIFMIVTPLLQQGVTVNYPERHEHAGRGCRYHKGHVRGHLDP